MKKIHNFQEEVTGFKNENKKKGLLSQFTKIPGRHFGAVQWSST